MLRWGVRLLRRLAKLFLWVYVLLFAVFFVRAYIPIPGVNDVQGLPEVPPVDQVTLDKAAATRGGEFLRKAGYAPRLKVADRGLIAFLDEQQKKAGVANPGPYVVFGTGKVQAAKPDPGTPPDAIVDATNGVIVAASQDYGNGRGAACYNSSSIDVLAGHWVIINTYLWGKSMPQVIPVSHAEVAQLPQGITLACYVYPS